MRHLDGEGHEERQEEQHLLAGSERKPAARDHVHNGRVAERLRAVVEVDDGRQHQHRAGHGEQEKLHRRVDAALVAPDADQEVHGHQRDFPEHVEQKQVLRQEHAHQPEFEQQQKRVELLHAVLDGAPGDQHADGRQERRKQHQPQAHAVGRHVVVDVGRGDPRHVQGELLAGHAAVEYHGQGQRCRERRQRNGEGPDAAALRRRTRHQQRDQESRQRQRQNEGRQVHRRPPAIPIATISSTEPNSTHVA